jgi:WD40 repeat protein
MAVKLLRHPVSQTVLVLSGYEGGLTAIHQLPCASNSSVRPAQLIYLSQPHTQPILSLDASPDARIYFTSSADAVVAGHHIPELTPVIDELDGESMQDEDSIKVGKGAGPATDSITRGESAAQETVAKQDILISPTQPSESLSFAKQSIPSLTSTTIPSSAGLSSLLSSTPAQTELRSSAPQRFPPATILPPYKTLNTKHAGQQSLRVRSDGRLFVTGGWDSRIRIYSAKTLKEVAVLKWHKEGIYAVDFAQVLETGDLRSEDEIGRMAMTKETGLGRLQKQREETMQCKHWVAAGAKDGKISLWEVF